MFSEREKLIIKIIGRKKSTISKIADVMVGTPGTGIPFDAEITVGNAIRRIIKKCEHYKLDWTLVKKRSDGKLLISKEKV